jgi:stage IV sporulation protein FB
MFGATETPYDLRFQALGIPVRIHPFFWLVMAMLGWEPENMPSVGIFVACAFLSILVHEYGHGLVAKGFGARPSIVLWGLGGLCMYHNDRQLPRQRLAVLLCGPGAGFVLCGVTMLTYSLAYGLTPAEHLAFARRALGLGGDVGREVFGLVKMGLKPEKPYALYPQVEVYWDLVRINILWGALNLLPIWPMDGGQVTETILSQVSPYNGRRWTHTISLVAAGLIAILIYTWTRSFFNTLLFGYFAVINYQMLDMIHRAQTMGVYDEDWWRK